MAGQLFSKDTQAIFYNWKQLPVQRMLDFDFLCGEVLPQPLGRFILQVSVARPAGMDPCITDSQPRWTMRAGRTKPSVACIVQPGAGEGFQKLFFGREEIAIPSVGR